MGRKPDRPADAPEGGLQHNPFAALAALKGGAAAPVPAAAPLPVAKPQVAPAAPPRPSPVASERPGPPARPAESTGPKVKSLGRLVLRRETKHRGGKAVIVISGAGAIAGLDVAGLAKELKQKLGCGGTVDDHDGEPEIVLSGDRAAKVAELLRAKGYRVDGVTS